jgi:hypothetical protein
MEVYIKFSEAALGRRRGRRRGGHGADGVGTTHERLVGRTAAGHARGRGRYLPATAGVYWLGTPRGAAADGVASGGDLRGGER